MSGSSADVSVIIVSWNVKDLLAACLHSIFLNTDDRYSLEVIVVDSASSDGTPTMIVEQFPQVTLLSQVENVGFTRGNNIGLKTAEGRLLFLLNPDTIIHGDTVQRLAGYLDTHREVGIVGPQTLNSDGTYQSTRRLFPTLPLVMRDSLWQSFHCSSLPPSHISLKSASIDSTHEVDWLQGSALMARREVYSQIGGLDERFFMFSEEVDWCKRATDTGWKIVYVGSARITHHGGRSTEQVAAQTLINYNRSKVQYFRKHYGNLEAEALRAYIVLGCIGSIVVETTKALIGHKRAIRQERIKRYVQLLRSSLRGA